MGLEEALECLGKYGRWQMLTYVVITVTFCVPAAWQLFAIVFIAAVTDHHCRPWSNMTIAGSIPTEKRGDRSQGWSKCSMYVPGSNQTLTSCKNGWQFEPSDFDPDKGTIVMEWTLVCERGPLVETSQTIFAVGSFIGTIVFTPLADRFGRKRIVFLCLMLTNIFGTAMAFSPNYGAFCIFQFLTGAFTQGLLWTGFIIVSELFPAEQRAIMSPGASLIWAVCTSLLTPWAYYIRNWRQLQMAISLAGLPFLLYYPWCPESIRWLLSWNRLDDAWEILHTAERINKVTLPRRILDSDVIAVNADDKETRRRSSMRDMLGSPKARRYMFTMNFLVFANGIMYFGLSYLTSVLPGDRYVNFFTVCIVEVPSTICAIISLTKIGRRVPVCIFHLFAALFLGLASILASDIDVPGMSNVQKGYTVTALALVGKLGVGAAFVVELIYQQEIYPTAIRATGVGITQGIGVLGGIVAPYAVYAFRLMPFIPMITFAVFSLVAGFLALTIPETYGRSLPETVTEIELWPLTLTDADRKAMKAEREKKYARAMDAKNWQVSVVSLESNGLTNPGYMTSSTSTATLRSTISVWESNV